MATPFQAELVTPERVLYSGEAEEVSMRTDGGEIAFLAHHAELVAAVDITVVRIRSLEGRPGGAEDGDAEGAELRFTAHGGFVHVGDNVVRIFTSVAERADEIDVDRARQALAAARERLQAEGPATLEARPAEGGAGAGEAPSPGPSAPLSGAMVALLAASSAEAAVRRAEARLEAAGVRAEG